MSAPVVVRFVKLYQFFSGIMPSKQSQAHFVAVTDRLCIRWLTCDDAAFIVELFNSKDWLESVGDRGIRTEEQGREFLANGWLKSYEENGYGSYAIIIRESGVIAGIAGVLRRDIHPGPDVGFALLPEFHGQGYANEAMQAVLAHAKLDLKMPIVYAVTRKTNLRSIRLLEKLGMTIAPDSAGSFGEELLLFELQLN